MKSPRITALLTLYLTILLIFPSPIFADEPIRLLNHDGGVRSVAFSPVDASIFASAGESRVVKLWNIQNDSVAILRGHTDTINAVAFSTDGALVASASEDGYLKLWDVQSLQNIETLTHIMDGSRWRVKEVVFSPDGQVFATAIGQYVRLWDVDKRTEIGTLRHNQSVQAVAFSPNGQLLAAGDGSNDGPGTVTIWEVQSQRVIVTLEADEKQVHTVAFSPGGGIVASAGVKAQIRLWDTSNWELLNPTPYQGHYDITFSPGGKVLASAGHGSVSLLSVQSGEKIASLTGSTGWMHPVDFSPNGNFLVVGGEDGIVRIWDVEPYLPSQKPQKMVRLIYFLPRDRWAQLDIDAKLNKLVKDVQQLYAIEMARHGFEGKTFAFETDETGRAVVHHVDAEFADSYYHEDTFSKVWKELSEQFDPQLHIINLVAVDISTGAVGQLNDVYVGGVAAFDLGTLLIPASGRFFNVSTTAHEIGHTFGLQHDFRDNAYIMSYGSNRNQLSQCAAEWLDASRFFNPDREPIQTDQETTIKMLQPFASSATIIRLRFEITDADGLHQAQLLIPATVDDSVSGIKIHSCQSLTDQVNAEFLTENISVESEVTLQVIDVHGNITKQVFSVNLDELASIPDSTLRTAIEKALGKAPGSPIRIDEMATLTRLEAFSIGITPKIKDLTGLESASQLEYLSLGFNEISDIRPLANLTRLKELSLTINQVSDISPLANLTQLELLDLLGNQISDISPLANLTQLKKLYLTGNEISDIRPLANLTQLELLVPRNNQISDINPLANLTKLKVLNLGSNEISDISPLTNLTGLEDLDLWKNQISDISPLANLTQLKKLDLGKNPIQDTSPICPLLAQNPDLELDIEVMCETVAGVAADVNGDGVVDVEDLVFVWSALLLAHEASPNADVNGNGIVDIWDFVAVAKHLDLGELGESEAPGIGTEISVPYDTVRRWIEMTHAADDGSLAFKQGIENLQNLLASLIPEETALFANYPNPFNPETWIPYQLAESAEVTLTIYDMNGQLVRRLAVGHQAAGTYQSRSRAVYWDGRNQLGESVASGLYFYTLTAGEFIATRRMVILK